MKDDDIPLIKPAQFVYSEFGTNMPVRFLGPSQINLK